jgi:SAM-dependent methyltransferase
MESEYKAKSLRHFKHQMEVSNKEYWKRLGIANLKGKRVIEIGCGFGALSVSMASLGAEKVVAFDIEEERIKFAKSNLEENYPEFVEIVEFHCISLNDISSDDLFTDQFDLAVSKDAFEHVDNLSKMMQQIMLLLKSGGALLSGFGPLYFSPYGDHGRYLNHQHKKIPWLPLIPEFILFPLVSVYLKRNIHHARDLGLNKLTPKQFRQIVSTQQWTPEYLHYNRGNRKGMSVMRFLRKIPLLEAIFTVNIYTKLVKNSDT